MNNKIAPLTVSIMLLVFISILTARGSRMEPDKVDPVIHKGVTYRVNHEKMGFVEAWDGQSGKLLWEARIYRVFYNPFLERDVQDVYIKSLEIKGDILLITNEKNKKFNLDIKTREVSSGN